MNVIEDRSKKSEIIKPSSVGFVVFNRQLVLIKRNEIHGLHDSGKWSLPGGEVDPGETYDKALKRELKEEINLDIEKLSNSGSIIQIGGNEAMGAVHGLYVVLITEEIAKGLKLGDEGQAIGRFDINTLIDHIDELGVNLQFLVSNGLSDLLNAIIDKKDIDLTTLRFKVLDIPREPTKTS